VRILGVSLKQLGIEVKMKKTLFAVIALLVGSVAANANTLTLTAVSGNQYQQTVQSPCIFVNPSCQQGSFNGTDLPTGGAVNGYDSLSPVYSGAMLNAIIGAGNSLILGIDINQASGQPAQTLATFTMSKNGVVVDTFTGSTGNVPAGNNGNGFADFTLTGFSSMAAGDQIQFHLVFNDANDGTENVFIVGGTPSTNVPEPSSLMTLGFGLLILAFTSRKLARKNS
jgi:hypothetical protein